MSAVVRGRLSHSLLEDCSYLIAATTSRVNCDGSMTRLFQSEFKRILGRQFCVSFQFARTGLYFALKALDLEAGTKIILPSVMIKAYVDVVLDLDLVPIFVDSDPRTGGPDIESLREAVNEGGRVFVLVYLFGIIPDLHVINEVISQENIFVIEDFSQAIDGSFREFRSGGFGDISIYSSSAVKIVDTFGGGHVFCDDEVIYEKLSAFEKTLKKPEKFFILRRGILSLFRNCISNRYFFNAIVFPLIKLFDFLGKAGYVNFVGKRPLSPIQSLPQEWFRKYTELQAKIGLQRLQKFKKENEETRLIADFYDLAIPISSRMSPPKDSKTFRWQYIFYHSNFEKCRKEFLKNRIDVAQTSLVNLSSLPEYGWNLDYKGARKVHEDAIYIPFFKELEISEARRVARVIQSLIN